MEPGEIGCCDLAEHRIRLNKDEPFKERYRPINPRHQEEVRDHIQKMLRAGAIKPSNSPWSNAVVLVRKKDGDLRFCIDFRRLSAITKKDSFPLPRIQEAIEFLSGARVFSCICSTGIQGGTFSLSTNSTRLFLPYGRKYQHYIDDVITVTSSKNCIKGTNAPKSTTQLLKPSDSSHRRCVCIDLR